MKGLLRPWTFSLSGVNFWTVTDAVKVLNELWRKKSGKENRRIKINNYFILSGFMVDLVDFCGSIGKTELTFYIYNFYFSFNFDLKGLNMIWLNAVNAIICFKVIKCVNIYRKMKSWMRCNCNRYHSILNVRVAWK